MTPVNVPPSSTAVTSNQAQAQAFPAPKAEVVVKSSSQHKARAQVMLIQPGARVSVRGVAKKRFTVKRADDPKGLAYLLEEVPGVYPNRDLKILPPQSDEGEEPHHPPVVSPSPSLALGAPGFALLSGDAVSLLPALEAYVSKLVFAEMDVMPATQSDKLRRVHAVSKANPLHAQLVAYGEDVMGRVLGESEGRVPVYKPIILGTAPGADPQREHADYPHPNAFSLLIAIQPREFGLVGRAEPLVLSSPGDVLVFDATRCHYGAGRAGDAEGVAFAVHLFAGAGVDPADLADTFGCS